MVKKDLAQTANIITSANSQAKTIGKQNEKGVLAKDIENKHGLVQKIKVIQRPVLSSKEEPRSPQPGKK